MEEETVSALVVDDEESIREILRLEITDRGFLCEEAENGLIASEKLEQKNFNLVLLDITMPQKTGLDVLQEINTHYPDTAVIMITAISDINIAVNCMKKGAFDYLIKPFHLENVNLSIDRALEFRRLKLENKEYRLNLEEKVVAQARKIRNSFLSAITALATALEAKDKYTSGHSERVATIGVAIAEAMMLSPEMVERIRLAGLLHDIGKIGVGESILNKPGKLTHEEFKFIRSHPEMGERILTPVAEDESIMNLVRSHHERHDGSGYPDGLKATQIPLGARILSISDAFEAMTSNRPYRKAMNKNVALGEIKRGKGTQFDPEIVDIFLNKVHLP